LSCLSNFPPPFPSLGQHKPPISERRWLNHKDPGEAVTRSNLYGLRKGNNSQSGARKKSQNFPALCVARMNQLIARGRWSRHHNFSLRQMSKVVKVRNSAPAICVQGARQPSKLAHLIGQINSSLPQMVERPRLSGALNQNLEWQGGGRVSSPPDA